MTISDRRSGETESEYLDRMETESDRNTFHDLDR